MDVTEIGSGYERWMDFATVARHNISGILFANSVTSN
jgi:hypothetical protein